VRLNGAGQPRGIDRPKGLVIKELKHAMTLVVVSTSSTREGKKKGVIPGMAGKGLASSPSFRGGKVGLTGSEQGHERSRITASKYVMHIIPGSSASLFERIIWEDHRKSMKLPVLVACRLGLAAFVSAAFLASFSRLLIFSFSFFVPFALVVAFSFLTFLLNIPGEDEEPF